MTSPTLNGGCVRGDTEWLSRCSDSARLQNFPPYFSAQGGAIWESVRTCQRSLRLGPGRGPPRVRASRFGAELSFCGTGAVDSVKQVRHTRAAVIRASKPNIKRRWFKGFIFLFWFRSRFTRGTQATAIDGRLAACMPKGASRYSAERWCETGRNPRDNSGGSSCRLPVTFYPGTVFCAR